MKRNNLTTGTFTLLLLASTVAGAEQQYPAADFQPEVLYQDSEYIAKNSSPSTKASAHKATSNTVQSSEVDSKYPAANFQPEVLYQDPNYKPSTITAKASSSNVSVSSGSEKATSEPTSSATANKEESSFTSYLLGLVALFGAGFYLFRKNNAGAACTKAAKTSKTPAAVNKSYALNTGVAKYLNKVSGTGVSRYIETQVKSASVATGVAKYLAKQAVAPKATATKAATGVEKYMRDRG